jgi:hypothetical protein
MTSFSAFGRILAVGYCHIEEYSTSASYGE